LPDFITDQDITVLKRRAASAKIKMQAQVASESKEEVKSEVQLPIPKK